MNSPRAPFPNSNDNSAAMVLVGVGLLLVLLFLFWLFVLRKQEGAVCTPTTAETVSGASTYAYNALSNCVLSKCMTGYTLVGNTCSPPVVTPPTVTNVDCEIEWPDGFTLTTGGNGSCVRTATIITEPSGSGNKCPTAMTQSFGATDSNCVTIQTCEGMFPNVAESNVLLGTYPNCENVCNIASYGPTCSDPSPAGATARYFPVNSDGSDGRVTSFTYSLKKNGTNPMPIYNEYGHLFGISDNTVGVYKVNFQDSLPVKSITKVWELPTTAASSKFEVAANGTVTLGPKIFTPKWPADPATARITSATVAASTKHYRLLSSGDLTVYFIDRVNRALNVEMIIGKSLFSTSTPETISIDVVNV